MTDHIRNEIAAWVDSEYGNCPVSASELLALIDAQATEIKQLRAELAKQKLDHVGAELLSKQADQPDLTPQGQFSSAELAKPVEPVTPVAWLDDFGSVFPISARKGAESWIESWIAANQRNWKPLYLHPPTPAWHDAPTCDGLWVCNEGDDNPYRWTTHRVKFPISPLLVGDDEMWFGPIPNDAKAEGGAGDAS